MEQWISPTASWPLWVQALVALGVAFVWLTIWGVITRAGPDGTITPSVKQRQSLNGSPGALQVQANAGGNVTQNITHNYGGSSRPMSQEEAVKVEQSPPEDGAS